MATEDELVTAQGFFNYAEDYLEAAHVLGEHMRTGNHRGEVLKFVSFHAIELYMKAYLRQAGISARELRLEIGHNLRELMKRCDDHGLRLPEGIKGTLQLAEILRDPIEARYFKSAARARINHEGIYWVALKVRTLVQSNFVVLQRPFDSDVAELDEERYRRDAGD